MRISRMDSPLPEGLQITVIEMFQSEIDLLPKAARAEFQRHVQEATANNPASHLRALLVLAEELQKNNASFATH